ncbi:hypothetical protein [Spirosoma koreense]
MSSIPPNTIPRRPLSEVKFQADPINSTFRWELYLTPGKPGNRVALMDGYSKGLGFENTNKVELLYKKLINPILPYLSRCDRIVICEQDKGLPKAYHPVLIDLYPHDFAAYEWVKDSAFLMDYLKRYYNEFIHTGKLPPLEDRRKNARQAVYFADLDHSKHTFRTLQELKDFCAERKQKYSNECMVAWYYKHAEFQPELFDVDNTADLQHIIHTAKTGEEAQRAIDSMHAKFTRDSNP